MFLSSDFPIHSPNPFIITASFPYHPSFALRDFTRAILFPCKFGLRLGTQHNRRVPKCLWLFTPSRWVCLTYQLDYPTRPRRFRVCQGASVIDHTARHSRYTCCPRIESLIDVNPFRRLRVYRLRVIRASDLRNSHKIASLKKTWHSQSRSQHHKSEIFVQKLKCACHEKYTYFAEICKISSAPFLWLKYFSLQSMIWLHLIFRVVFRRIFRWVLILRNTRGIKKQDTEILILSKYCAHIRDKS